MTRESDDAALRRAADRDDGSHIFEWATGGFEWVPGAKQVPLARVHPLALAARMLEIVDYLASEPANRSEAPVGWIVMGITSAMTALVKHGEYEPAGLLLQALEELVPAENRRRWPLAGWLSEDGPDVPGAGVDVPAVFGREAGP